MKTEAQLEAARRKKRNRKRRDHARRDWENHIIKVHHLSKSEAQYAATCTMYQPGDHIPIHVYECPVCGWWITGHNLTP